MFSGGKQCASPKIESKTGRLNIIVLNILASVIINREKREWREKKSMLTEKK